MKSLRQSQSVLHTWSGLVAGWILFGIFLAGTVSFWREDINRWARPELKPGFDRAAVLSGASAFLERHARGAKSWTVELPGEGGAGTLLRWEPQPDPKTGTPAPTRESQTTQWLDGGGRPVAVRETLGGDFFYRLHFDLHYVPVLWARWFVGLCASLMLVAIVAGIVTHKKIIVDFFTFRPGKGQRSWLDGHNVASVVALPFHLMMTYTGLVTLMAQLMPWGVMANYPSLDAFYAAAFPQTEVARSGRAAPPMPLGRAVALAERRGGGRASYIEVAQPGDVAQRITIYRSASDRIAARSESVVIDGRTGSAVVAPLPGGGAEETRAIFIGLHAARYADLGLRWLYFLGGIAGTIMVSSGLVLWTVKRREKLPDPARPPSGLRLVERLNTVFAAGMPLAMTGFLWANRLLPSGIDGRAELEVGWMFRLWGAALLVSLLARPRIAWPLLFAATAASLVGLACADMVLTDAGLFASIARGDTAMTAIESAFLALGAAFAAIAARVRDRPAAASRLGRHRPVAAIPAE